MTEWRTDPSVEIIFLLDSILGLFKINLGGIVYRQPISWFSESQLIASADDCNSWLQQLIQVSPADDAVGLVWGGGLPTDEAYYCTLRPTMMITASCQLTQSANKIEEFYGQSRSREILQDVAAVFQIWKYQKKINTQIAPRTFSKIKSVSVPCSTNRAHKYA